MASKRGIRGELKQYDSPEWQPLLDLVGEEVTADFMWMHEVELSDGSSLHAYKHRDTRRYIHLREDGAAFYYLEPDRYHRTEAATQLTAVFAILRGLGGVTEEQVEASWNAVERAAVADEARDGSAEGERW